jgi:Fe-S-cluster containining protein
MICLLTYRGYYKPMRAAEVPSCSGCGACCGIYGVPIKAEESASLEPWTCDQRDEGRHGIVDYIPLVGAGGAAVKSKHRNVVCIADESVTGRCRKLTGTVGSDAACSIYHARPTDCRTFVAGSWNCLTSRLAMGLGVPGWFARAHARVHALASAAPVH